MFSFQRQLTAWHSPHLLLRAVLRRSCCWPPAVQQSIDIFWSPGPQQRSHSSVERRPDETDRQTDGRTDGQTGAHTVSVRRNGLLDAFSAYTLWIHFEHKLHLLVIIIISFSSPTLSFIPDLKPFFSKSLPLQPFFFSSELTTWFPRLLLLLLTYLLLHFSFSVLQFLVVVSVR